MQSKKIDTVVEPKQPEFPKLMIHTEHKGFVVMITGKSSVPNSTYHNGVVVWSDCRYRHVGDFDDSFDIRLFDKFDGQIVLSNNSLENSNG